MQVQMQDVSRFFLALLSAETPKALDVLFVHSRHRGQQPTRDELVSTFQQILEDFEQVFIILDALDECTEKEELLELLERIHYWKLDKLHILATSRKEKEIEESLESLGTGHISIESLLSMLTFTPTSVRYSILQNDPKLRKWPANVQKEIEDTLMEGSTGMFRWAVCQLDVLKKCLNVDALREALISSRMTLDETYTRILSNIDGEYRKDASKILQWLAYSARQLDINEVAEVLAVEIEDDPRFDPENRLPEPRDILLICSSLVTVVASTMSDDYGHHRKIEQLRFAHVSVRDYLTSNHISTAATPVYSINDCAEDRMAETCLIYLLQFQGSKVLSQENMDEFPLASYAAKYWTYHARSATNNAAHVTQLSMQLFESKTGAYINWIRLFDPDMPSSGIDMTKSPEFVPSPLYYASLEGLVKSVEALLRRHANPDSVGGNFGTALQAACVEGFEEIVRLILDCGADVNIQGGYFGTALQAASKQGHKTVVMLLLEYGADVNLQGGYYNNVLQAACVEGFEEIVRLLLDCGADVNLQGRQYSNSLQATSSHGHEEVVRLLLEYGADVNAQSRKDSECGNALKVASERGHKAIVRLLLDAGANVNTPGEKYSLYSDALTVASERGHEAIVRLLLENGADITMDDYDNDELQEALAAGQEAVVKFLIDKSPKPEKE